MFLQKPVMIRDKVLTILSLIHRGQESFIGFVRKPQTFELDKNGDPFNFENLGSIRVGKLNDEFAPMSTYLSEDAYITVNSFYRHAYWKNKLTGFWDIERKEKILRYLNTCYVDLDIGREDDRSPEKRQTYDEAMQVISGLIGQGQIPQPSIIAKSGRGIYLLWLLCVKGKPEEPPRAWPETIALYKAINKAVGSKLTSVAWDKKAHDAARVLRVHGSIHTKAQKPVIYKIQYDEKGKPFFYTLDALAAFYGIETTVNLSQKGLRILSLPNLSEFRKTKKKGSVPKRKKGLLSLNKKRADDLLKIEKDEGGFKKGLRRMKLTIYAELLQRLHPIEKATNMVKQMAKRCQPPYPSDTNDLSINNIMSEIYSGKSGSVRNWENKKLCRVLGISADRARKLNLSSIVPAEITKERKNKTGKREIEKKQRLKALKEIIKEKPNLSSRKIAGILKERGIKGNHSTVNKELAEIRRKNSD